MGNDNTVEAFYCCHSWSSAWLHFLGILSVCVSSHASCPSASPLNEVLLVNLTKIFNRSINTAIFKSEIIMDLSTWSLASAGV